MDRIEKENNEVNNDTEKEKAEGQKPSTDETNNELTRILREGESAVIQVATVQVSAV